MKRSLTSRDLLNKRDGRKLQIADPELSRIVGNVSASGLWLIYGKEKNGKTWFALQLAKELAKQEKVSYISAEESLEDSFLMACKRAGITSADRILWDEYMSIDAIIEKFSKPKTANVIFIDNLTVYLEELKPTEVKKRLMEELPGKLLILIAHEERKKPYPATARMAEKWASVVVQIQGLKALVVSRFSSGGEIVIDNTKSELYWGNE